MSDAMQIAHQRRKTYLSAIAQKEAEIAEMNEMIADLDSFIEFGDALLGKDPEKVTETPRPALAETPAATSDPDPDDEWETDTPQQNIARVISQRVG